MRQQMLPYGRQSIDEADIAAVTAVLRSDWLTTGPMVAEYERAFAIAVAAEQAVALSSGTAALHACMFALGISVGDEVLVSAMTFAASANCVAYQGGTPVFVDVEPDTLLISPTAVEARITPQTRAIVAVDFAGQPCDYGRLRAIAQRHGLPLVADGCHALGAKQGSKPVGILADLTAFSTHPVKHITTGEGGVVTTNNAELAQRMRHFRNHGITTDHRQREQLGSWVYEMVELGYNYRITDFQSALGISQLKKLAGWIECRQKIAREYDAAFGESDLVSPLTVRPDANHAYHLYVVRLNLENLRADRRKIFAALRAEGIGVNVHYLPVHLHPYYRCRFDTQPGLCPAAEAAYERIISLPIFPAMNQADIEDVITAVRKVTEAFRA